jgi:hypothetical protein
MAIEQAVEFAGKPHKRAAAIKLAIHAEAVAALHTGPLTCGRSSAGPRPFAACRPERDERRDSGRL